MFKTKTYKTFINELKQNKDNGMMAFFLIGCYPNIGGNKLHENPPIIDYVETSLDIPYIMFLIDPYYSDGYVPNYLQNCPKHNGIYYYGKRRVVICEDSLKDYDYILKLCDYISYLNCASYIADFTGKNKLITSSNSSIYIAPSNCLGDVTTIGYNPIITNKNNIIQFMKTDTIEDIYYQYKTLLKKNIPNFNKQLQFINWSIIRIINKMSKSHLNILKKVKNKDDTMYSYIKNKRVTPIYNKTSDIIDESIKHLLYRCQGYDIELIKLVVSKWLYSSYNSLKQYLDEHIISIINYVIKIKYEHLDTERYLGEYNISKGYTYKQIFAKIVKDFEY